MTPPASPAAPQTLPALPAEGMIELGHAPAHWGFTAEAFKGSYLWREGPVIWLSMIMAQHPGRGDFSRLVKAIRQDGFVVKVPTPFPQMQAICQRWGFTAHREGAVEVWQG